jgi:hypothetical protein
LTFAIVEFPYFISSDIHHLFIHSLLLYHHHPFTMSLITDWFGMMDISAVSEYMTALSSARQPPPQLPVYTDPDVPPCDGCSKEFSGNLICNSCHSAFYCSKGCQKNAWKHGGHKQSCVNMQEQCVLDAKRVVQALTRRSIEDCAAMEADDGNILEVLDGAGPYRAAVAEDLYEALREAFRDEAENIVERFRASKHPELCVISRAVVCYLFRGHRAEGRVHSTNQVDVVDGQRIKAYVTSHPKAFDVWMDASMATFRLPFDSRIRRRLGGSSNDQCEFIFKASRDVASAWIMVFANKRASRAILLPTVGDSKEAASRAAIDRAKQIADHLGGALRLTNGFFQRDPSKLLEGEILLAAGMVSCRVREFQIDFDFDGRLNIKKNAMMMIFRDLIKPMCSATIEKGSCMTDSETKAAVAAHGQKLRQEKSSLQPSR